MAVGVDAFELSLASLPVACIIEPSFRDSMSVDWIPGRDVRWDSCDATCWGIWDV